MKRQREQRRIWAAVTVVTTSLLWVAGCASTPPAPTLGDMLDKGATRATRADMLTFLQLGGPPKVLTSPAGGRTSISYKADGTFDGTVQFGTASSRSTGRWTVEDNGRFCVDEKLLDWNKQAFKCYFMYHLNDQVLVIESMTENRLAPVTRYPRAQ